MWTLKGTIIILSLAFWVIVALTCIHSCGLRTAISNVLRNLSKFCYVKHLCASLLSTSLKWLCSQCCVLLQIYFIFLESSYFYCIWVLVYNGICKQKKSLEKWKPRTILSAKPIFCLNVNFWGKILMSSERGTDECCWIHYLDRDIRRLSLNLKSLWEDELCSTPENKHAV